jgi:hypothetical protein
MANDPASVERGMKYFVGVNCVGCQVPNGGGGMGPSLSRRSFKFGADPASHFVLITHGAPPGMPAWGELLPETVIWDLVSCLSSISDEPVLEQEWRFRQSPTCRVSNRYRRNLTSRQNRGNLRCHSPQDRHRENERSLFLFGWEFLAFLRAFDRPMATLVFSPLRLSRQIHFQPCRACSDASRSSRLNPSRASICVAPP